MHVLQEKDHNDPYMFEIHGNIIDTMFEIHGNIIDTYIYIHVCMHI